MILEKLKTNGVEPGFIFHKDWSKNDSKSLMMDFNSEQSIQILETLKSQNRHLSDKCQGKEIREQIMLCGHSHPAIMSAVADYMLEQCMQKPDSDIYKAFCVNFPDTDPQNYRQIDVKELGHTQGDLRIAREIAVYLEGIHQ